jgi:mannose-P-dolichol utilization defect 1
MSAVLSARSARGLSLPAYVLETLSYAITLAYAFRNHFPFSTYGENFFLALQNTIITHLIIHYPSPSLRRAQNTQTRLIIASLASIACAIALYVLPTDILALLQFATLPLSVFSKLPQIRQNSRAQSTGQLSAFAVISQILGCLARLFTTATEVGDKLVAAGFALALLLNCILGAQMWMYWGKDEKEELGREFPLGGVANEKDESWAYSQESKSRVDIVVPQQSNVAYSQNNATQPSGRKWARKVD